jgi:hypothetical protein
MTFDEAASLSLARLKLMRRAAEKKRAAFMLQLMVAMHAASCAGNGWVKDGHRVFERVSKKFEEILE